MRRLAEQIVLGGILRRVVQEPQVGMRLVGEERREKLFRHVERDGKDRQYAVAHRAERAEICHHVVAHTRHERLGGHWLRPRNGLPATTSGWSAPRSWLTKKLSFWFGRVALCTVEAPCTEALIGR